jgi:hypothetical protein
MGGGDRRGTRDHRWLLEWRLEMLDQPHRRHHQQAYSKEQQRQQAAMSLPKGRPQTPDANRAGEQQQRKLDAFVEQKIKSDR